MIVAAATRVLRKVRNQSRECPTLIVVVAMVLVASAMSSCAGGGSRDATATPADAPRRSYSLGDALTVGLPAGVTVCRQGPLGDSYLYSLCEGAESDSRGLILAVWDAPPIPAVPDSGDSAASHREAKNLIEFSGGHVDSIKDRMWPAGRGLVVEYTKDEAVRGRFSFQQEWLFLADGRAIQVDGRVLPDDPLGNVTQMDRLVGSIRETQGS